MHRLASYDLVSHRFKVFLNRTLDAFCFWQLKLLFHGVIGMLISIWCIIYHLLYLVLNQNSKILYDS